MEIIAPVTHILPITTIRRERVLPLQGRVMVRKGQKVTATDTIAEATLTPAHLLLEVARGLGVSASQADEQIQVRAGDQVAEGDIVAGPIGFPRRVVRATRGGRVILAGSGQVLIEVQNRPFELKAGIPGTVSELVPDRGAIVETTGALIQGVWGNGLINFGLMYVLAKQPDQLLTADQLDVSMRGAIVVGGYVDDLNVFKTATELPLRGLVLASLDPGLESAALQAKFPIMLIDGFGHRPMDSVAYNLLSTSERREVALNAEAWDRYKRTRPELVIPLPASGGLPLPHDTTVFMVSQQVRVRRPPYAGMIGTLQDLLGPVILPSGIRAVAADVLLEDGNTAVLPLANLEVLE